MASESSGEFDRRPVVPERLLPARHFAASYAGEHVAGTEFVIGAMFVAWGVSTSDVIGGLILGNLLAVLSWALLCAPLATNTRLTLYAYLEKIAGPSVIRLYSVINGIFFCILGGAMITVSASAVRILFDIPAQVHWYPSSFAFVLVALMVGAVVVTVAMRGFAIVARFAEICAPWMILMFAAGAMALWPLLSDKAGVLPGTDFLDALWHVGDTYIWVESADSEMTFWHVAAFAWICNLPMHVGLSDMTVLRFARRARYGWFSALGMYIGHFCAWICAGIMGAGAATLLNVEIESLDAGGVAFQTLGSAGIVAVIIAGWTTSNPTIYRAGLAFQSLSTRWSRRQVTIITGVLTTIVACFPFVFSELMGFLGLMGLLLVPIGAIIIAEHWVFPRLGLTRYWSAYQRSHLNKPALFAWLAALLFAWWLNSLGVHLFFLLVPAWLTAFVLYIALASAWGANGDYGELAQQDENNERQRRQDEVSALSQVVVEEATKRLSIGARLCRTAAWLSLLGCAGMAWLVFSGWEHEWLRSWLIVPSVLYFIFATCWVQAKEA